MTFPEPLAVLAALAALVTIGPWVKVATSLKSGDDRTFKRSLGLAATGTAITLGLFVFGVGAMVVVELFMQ